MNFGSVSEVSGDGVVSTALVPKENRKNHHFVTLEGVSVGNKFIPYNSSIEVRSIKLPLDPPLSSPRCYKNESVIGIAPTITLHFEGGAKLPLSPEKTFYKQLGGDGSCLAIQGNGDDVGVLGSFTQSNTFVGIDIDNQIVSFKPTDCTKH